MTAPPTVVIGSLFSGLAGLDLGLEWALADAGIASRVAWFVEKEPFCRGVLARHYPDAALYDDVCAVGAHDLSPVDVLTFGFPCQDVSVAGRGDGLGGARSGLFYEAARIVGELRPRIAVMENVSALLGRGFGDVLGTLAGLGYDAWWTTLRAAEVGAPHRRERVFAVFWLADAEPQPRGCESDVGGRAGDGGAWVGVGLADSNGARLPQREGIARDDGTQLPAVVGSGGERNVADTDTGRRDQSANGSDNVPDAHSNAVRVEPRRGRGTRGTARPTGAGDDGAAAGRLAQPGVGERMFDGVPRGLEPFAGWRGWAAPPGHAQHPWEPPRTTGRCRDRAARLRAAGNAVVPQCAYVIGSMVAMLLREGLV